MVDVLVHRERHLRVGAVDRARRRVDQVLHAVVPAAFEDMQEADEVGVDVGVRVVERIAHAGLRRQVDDPLDAGANRARSFAVGEVELVEGEAGPLTGSAQRAFLSLGS